ncbi:MAG TPA: glycosyltransferase [Rubricoccaceae bacterium]
MRITVAIATIRRPEVLDETVRRLAGQTEPPAAVVLSCVDVDDVSAATRALPSVTVVTGPKGLPRQRNRAADAAADADVVVFLDDDVALAPDYLARARAFAEARPDVPAFFGDVLADGILVGGLSWETADSRIAARPPAGDAALDPAPELYGCNMVVRRTTLDAVRFDDRLPGYAWLEDVDFSRRCRALGPVGQYRGCQMVHLGVPSGRQRGLPHGYSQVANPLYLWQKGVVRFPQAVRYFGRPLLKNAVFSLRDPSGGLVDRRGRLRGNALALLDAARGRVRPERTLDL